MGAGSSSGQYTPFSLAAALHPRLQVGNAIGRGNRHLFLTFLWLELGAILASTLLAVVRIHDGVTAAGKRVSSAAAIARLVGGQLPACGGHWYASRIASTLLICPARVLHPPCSSAPTRMPPRHCCLPRGCRATTRSCCWAPCCLSSLTSSCSSQWRRWPLHRCACCYF